MKNTKNDIYIIGAGAIGKALATFLAIAGKKVVLLRGSVDNQSTFTERVQVTLDENTQVEAEIEISTLSSFKKLDGIIVLTNKSYGNKNLAQALKEKVDNSPIVILQNGLGVEQAFIDNHFPEIYRCVLFVTSQVVAENKLTFKPVAASPIGRIKTSQTELKSLVDQLSSPGFPFKAESDIQPVIWRKAIINCVFNSICPLLEIDNGVFHREDRALQMAKRIIGECVAISSQIGISLDQHEVAESLLLISKSSDGQLISTLQDIRNKRQTEIETLNFEIVRTAKTLNKEDQVRETKLLGELTKLKSERNTLNAGAGVSANASKQ